MLKVLVVDDSVITRKHIGNVLTVLGHTVVASAKNNEEAMYSQSEYDIDLVTMDITMPGIDGIVTAGDMIKKDPRTKIIMVTSQGQEDMVVDAMKAGALGYILKPITKDKLEKVINRIFHKHTD